MGQYFQNTIENGVYDQSAYVNFLECMRKEKYKYCNNLLLINKYSIHIQFGANKEWTSLLNKSLKSEVYCNADAVGGDNA